MRRFKTQLNLVRAALMLLIALLTTGPAWANESYRYFDVSSRTFKTGTVPNGATILTEADNTIYKLGEYDSTSWYVMQGSLTRGERFILRGTVNLVLCNGANLTVRGISLTNHATLNIYAQTEDTSTMGELTSTTTSDDHAGIGPSYYTSYTDDISINIHGGKITASGGYGNAGIGGSGYKSGGTINIFGGVVTAQGGKSAAGIGSGFASPTTDVNIYGGQITAYGGDDAAGIGAGCEADQCDIFLSWNNPNFDWIYSSSYNGTVTIDPDHGFMLAETGEEATTSNIGGKKIVPDQATIFLVTFNTGEGSTAVASQGIINGQTATMPENPYRKGYRFLKWQLNGVDYDFSAPVTSNIELTAVWTPLPDIQYVNTTNVSTTLAGADYTPMESTVTMLNNNDIWVVVDDVTITSRITVKGNVTLILTDGKTLTAQKGISVARRDNASLTILAQRGGTGTLIAGRDHQDDACIGGNGSDNFADCGTVSIYGGHVQTQGNYMGAGIGGGCVGQGGTINIMGGQVDASGSEWGGHAIGYGYLPDGASMSHAIANITLGWRNESDYIRFLGNSGSANCKGTVTLASNFFLDGTTTSATWESNTDNNFWGQKLVPDLTSTFSVSDDGNTYTIFNATGWDLFCDMLEGGESFSGKTVKLDADISITRTAGSSDHEFMGTFDGDYHTLTVNITDTTTQGTAPFREIRGATIRKLITTGSVNGSLHAAGLVGFARGDASVTNTIEHCKVAANVTVTTAVNGNYHCGGVVGHALNSTLNISNTVYCGAISNSGNYVGGFQGWSDGNTVNLSNCLFTGSYEGGGVFHPMAVSYRNAATTATVNNSFYSATPTLTNAQYIAANGTKTVGVTTIPATLGSEVDTLNFMTVYEGGILFDGLYYAAPILSTDSDGAFVINNASDWEYFCEDLLDNDTWNRFSGKTVKLGADISVTRMAGSASHDFCGTFDGNHKTITFNYGSEAEPESGISALFSHTSSTKPFGVDTISPATIKDLTVDGTIWTSGSEAAGFVGRVFGTLNLTGCTSNIAINSTADFPAGFINYSDQTSTVNISGCTSNATINTAGSYGAGLVGHLYGSVNIEHCISNAEITAASGAGGFVGLCEHAVGFNDCLSSAVIHSADGNNSGFVGWSRSSDFLISFEGCAFNGKLLQQNGSGHSNGGFVGWKGDGKTVTITNCLVDPAALAQGETMATSGTATFSREHTAYAAIITNSYFTDTLGAVQGKQAHSIIAGEGVTVGFSGTAAEYETSGITAYGTGIMYNGVLYAGLNDEVSLNLDGSANGYSVNAGTLTGEGNPFTLLMPDENVAISAVAQFQRGDVNGNNEVTIADVSALIDYLLTGDTTGINMAAADCNGIDGVTIADVSALIDYLLTGSW